MNNILSVENLCLWYGSHQALKDINIEIPEKSITALIGPSGCGKSTFLKTLDRMNDLLPDVKITGSVLYKGEDIFDSSVDVSELSRQVGMVFQNFNLFPQYTALQNVMLAGELLAKERPDYRANKKAVHAQLEQQARELLAQMGLSERADHYPHQLSGGQQQRVAIARALAADPEIIYFDEPTSALDPELTGEVLSVMRQLAEEGMTMLVVTHEMGFARNVSSKTVFMENGVVVEQAPSQQFFASPKEERTRAFLRRIAHAE